MKKILMFIPFLVLLVCSLPAESPADSLDAFIAQLRQEERIPADDEWMQRLRLVLEEQARRGTIHASAYGLVAEMSPPAVDGG